MNQTINQKKYENAILYICQQLGGSVSGKKKFYKLLYYCDFDSYEFNDSMHTITGDKYKAWEMGPVPQYFSKIIEKLKKTNSISEHIIENIDGYAPTTVYTARTKANISCFTNDELFILNRVIQKYGHLNGKQLELLTHAEAPYAATEHNAIIAYELAFYRGTNFNDTLSRAS